MSNIVTPATILETVVSVSDKMLVTKEHHSNKRIFRELSDETDAYENPNELYLTHGGRIWKLSEPSNS